MHVINDPVGGNPVVVFRPPGTASALAESAVAAGRDLGSAVSSSDAPTPNGISLPPS
ncbi:MAG: DUF3179 domain-containing protein [Ardenticatenaceae bacterium]|nr:DUF3179 domain-containing protein [Ardenticatenaceae bacterium]